MISTPVVFASVQEVSSGRVYIIFEYEGRFLWTRTSRGKPLFGPFSYLSDLFEHMAQQEGETPNHWLRVFSQFRPDVADHFVPTLKPGAATFVRA